MAESSSGGLLVAAVVLYQPSMTAYDPERFMSAVRIAVGPDRTATIEPKMIENSEEMLWFTARVRKLIFIFSYRGPLPANAPGGPSVGPELARRMNDHVDALILEVFAQDDEAWATRAVTRLAAELAEAGTKFLWNLNRERLVEVTPAAREVLRSECPEDVYRDAVDAPPFRGDGE